MGLTDWLRKASNRVNQRHASSPHGRTECSVDAAGRMNLEPGGPLDELPDLLTVLDVQQVLRISRTSAYERIRDGTIASIKVGGLIRVRKSALVRFIEGAGE